LSEATPDTVLGKYVELTGAIYPMTYPSSGKEFAWMEKIPKYKATSFGDMPWKLILVITKVHKDQKNFSAVGTRINYGKNSLPGFQDQLSKDKRNGGRLIKMDIGFGSKSKL